MKRDYYSDSIANFRNTSPNESLVQLVRTSGFSIEQTQRDAWLEEFRILKNVLSRVVAFAHAAEIDPTQWEGGRYSASPTIIDGAMALYNNHSVTEISRSDAAAINLTVTSATILEILESARATSFKAICFVTGVPG